jgi:hypothetical protein
MNMKFGNTKNFLTQLPCLPWSELPPAWWLGCISPEFSASAFLALNYHEIMEMRINCVCRHTIVIYLNAKRMNLQVLSVKYDHTFSFLNHMIKFV